MCNIHREVATIVHDTQSRSAQDETRMDSELSSCCDKIARTIVLLCQSFNLRKSIEVIYPNKKLLYQTFPWLYLFRDAVSAYVVNHLFQQKVTSQRT